MNWLQKIRNILGKFWYIVFQELDFLHGLEYVESLYASLIENSHTNWFGGLIAKSLGVKQEDLPFVIYIEKDSITHPIYDLDSILTSSEYTFQTLNENGGWVAKVANTIKQPHILQDHIKNWSHAWIEDLDFRYKNNEILFFTDPQSFNLPVVKKATSTGEVKLYYRMFGMPSNPARSSDMVYGFISPELVPYADVVWDMHQNGASWYLIKQLLAAVTDTVVAQNSGTVRISEDTRANGFSDYWVENEHHCLKVGDRVYHSKQPLAPWIVDGYTVTPGTILFGSTAFSRGRGDADPADIPGIGVLTDVGPLVAVNTDNPISSTSYESGGKIHYILPLMTKDNEISAAYVNKCKALIDKKAPELYCQVPASVNPYDFVVNKIRRGRSGIVRIFNTITPKLAEALNCIRKCMHAGGILSVYVNTETEILVPLTVTAAASVSAITSTGGITITTNGVEASPTT